MPKKTKLKMPEKTRYPKHLVTATVRFLNSIDRVAKTDLRKSDETYVSLAGCIIRDITREITGGDPKPFKMTQSEMEAVFDSVIES